MEVLYDSQDLSPIVLLVAIFGALALTYILFISDSGKRSALKQRGGVVLAFVALLGMLTFALIRGLVDRGNLSNAPKSIVEGKIENYRIVSKMGRFSVGDAEFNFNPPYSFGTPMLFNGMRVRIEHVAGRITRIERLEQGDK